MESRIYLVIALATVLAVVVKAKSTGRIVGGYDASPAEFPHQISLRYDHRHTCGGSIISKNYILTAAHCVVESGTTALPAKHFTVRAGTHNRIAGGVIIQVKRIVIHQEYNVENDMALLELEEDLVWSTKIQPIELMEDEVPAGSEVVISGWGLLETNGDSLPIILQHNKVEAISKTKCASMIAIYSDAIQCLNHPKGAGACNGDSGGPATYKGKLIGVAGFVILGCGSSRPDGYAKVSYNLDWIYQNMK